MTDEQRKKRDFKVGFEAGLAEGIKDIEYVRGILLDEITAKEKLVEEIERLERASVKMYEGFTNAVEFWKAECQKLICAIEEHIECEPGMYGNECVGLGGADGLRTAIVAYKQAKKERS